MPSIIDETPGLSYQPDDVVSLAPTADARTRVGTNESAELLLNAIARSGKIELAELASLLSSTYGLDDEQAFNDVATFVHRAQVAGAVSMHSSWLRRMRHSLVYPVVDLLMFPARLGYPQRGARREYRPPTAGATVRIALATQWAFALALAVPFAAVLALLFQPAPLSHFLVGFGAAYVLAMTVTGVLHECAHFAIARAVGVPVLAVYRERSTVGMRRARGRPLQELAITAAGPVVAIAVLAGLLVWVVATSWDPRLSVVIQSTILGLLAASTFHLACLLPPSTDGRALVTAVKGLRP